MTAWQLRRWISRERSSNRLQFSRHPLPAEWAGCRVDELLTRPSLSQLLQTSQSKTLAPQEKVWPGLGAGFLLAHSGTG